MKKKLDVYSKYNELAWVDEKEIEYRLLYKISKRLLDLILSCIGILFLVPVFLWIIYNVYKDDPDAPVVFKQKRVGKNGKTFVMYKFRSMCSNAEARLESLIDKNEIDGAMFKIKDDPRVTEFGRFIRRTSLDELPQLMNVIKGEMSLIGPRPPLEREVVEYTEYDKQRLLVKPGCSGLWQISGRNNLQFHEMVALDIEYIQKRSLGYDVRLIFKTISVILKMGGAY